MTGDALRAPESDREPAPGTPTLGTGERQPRASRAGEKPYACGGCPTRWSGGGRAHCSGCHLTFNTTSLFDLHRRLRGEHGFCVEPDTIETKDGPLRLMDGVWCGPELPAEALAKLRGAR